MRTPIRKTAYGQEYWDTEEKRIILVPKGKNPDFDVELNPDSLIKTEPPELKPKVEVQEADDDNQEDELPSLLDSKPAVNEEDDIDQLLQEEDDDPEELAGVDFQEMTIKALREYAGDNKIEIPKDIKLKDDIIEHISDVEMERELVE